VAAANTLRNMRTRVLLVVALGALWLVPFGSGASSPSVNMALVPVPKSALGAAGHSLPLARDSGAVSNALAASESSGDVTPTRLKKLGRVGGYLLDYGNPFVDSPGVREIQTEIDRYRSTADARKGLAFWRRDELDNTRLNKLGLDFSLKKLRLSGIPGPHWVYAGTAVIKGLEPVTGVDAELQDGQYILDVSIAAGTNAAAARLVPSIVRKLDQRLKLALAGHLHGKPVPLAHALKPGPPAHGPKPAALALRATDLGAAKVVHKGYSKPKNALDPNALSVYDLDLSPAGSYLVVSQELLVGASKLEAQYFGAIASSAVTAGLGKVGKVTPVALTGIGDNARGEFLQVTISGQSAYVAVVVLSRGSYLDFVDAASASALTTANVHQLAQLAAKRLDKGFGG
jgi:hypothetical protein